MKPLREMHRAGAIGAPGFGSEQCAPEGRGWRTGPGPGPKELCPLLDPYSLDDDENKFLKKIKRGLTLYRGTDPDSPI